MNSSASSTRRSSHASAWPRPRCSAGGCFAAAPARGSTRESTRESARTSNPHLPRRSPMPARLGSLVLCAAAGFMLMGGCCSTRQTPPGTGAFHASDEPDLSKLKAIWPYTLVIYPHQDGSYYVALVCANEFKVRRPEPIDTGVVGPEQPVNTGPRTKAGGGPPQIEIAGGWAYLIGSAPMVGSQT